ncbi:hypothetical protein [Streptomyces sp. NPDC005799]|uniref:hypothetical protein n=1 Tax=Streptomyces sp. NPDC005799 TaxID=3154678 RepID=UPI0033F98909
MSHFKKMALAAAFTSCTAIALSISGSSHTANAASTNSVRLELCNQGLKWQDLTISGFNQNGQKVASRDYAIIGRSWKGVDCKKASDYWWKTGQVIDLNYHTPDGVITNHAEIPLSAADGSYYTVLIGND